MCLTGWWRNWAWRTYWTCHSSCWVMGRQGERGLLGLLWRPLKYFCRKVSALAFCLSRCSPLPLLSILCHTPISFLPSLSLFLPFYFFLAHLSASFLFLLTPSSLFLIFFPFIAHVFSLSFSVFPPPHSLVSLLLSLHFSPSPSLSSSPSSLLPHFPSFNPHTNTPFLPHLAGLDPTSRTHLTLLDEFHASRAPRITMGIRAQEEILGWVAHVLDVGEGVLRLGPGRGGKGSLGFFQKLMVLKDGKEQGEWKEGELASMFVLLIENQILACFDSKRPCITFTWSMVPQQLWNLLNWISHVHHYALFRLSFHHPLLHPDNAYETQIISNNIM